MIKTEHQDLRAGQYLINFLQWIAQNKVCNTIDGRYADIFYTSDELLEEWEQEFIAYLDK